MINITKLACIIAFTALVSTVALAGNRPIHRLSKLIAEHKPNHLPNNIRRRLGGFGFKSLGKAVANACRSTKRNVGGFVKKQCRKVADKAKYEWKTWKTYTTFDAKVKYFMTLIEDDNVPSRKTIICFRDTVAKEEKTQKTHANKINKKVLQSDDDKEQYQKANKKYTQLCVITPVLKIWKDKIDVYEQRIEACETAIDVEQHNSCKSEYVKIQAEIVKLNEQLSKLENKKTDIKNAIEGTEKTIQEFNKQRTEAEKILETCEKETKKSLRPKLEKLVKEYAE